MINSLRYFSFIYNNMKFEDYLQFLILPIVKLIPIRYKAHSIFIDEFDQSQYTSHKDRHFVSRTIDEKGITSHNLQVLLR